MMKARLSRSETKQEIFNFLANHFKATGYTRTITIEEIVQLSDDRPRRIEALISEMMKEGVLILADEDECSTVGKCYKLSGMAYMQLVIAMSKEGTLPPNPLGDDQPWIEGNLGLL